MSGLAEAQEHFGVREWGWRAPLAVRLLRNAIESDGCWLWQARLSDGYGRMSLRGVEAPALAHRVSYEFFRGSIPTGMQLDHLCRHRACVNPSHLEPVTSRENTMRGLNFAATNAARTHCQRGHAFDNDNTRMRASGERVCRDCERQRRRDYRARAAARAPRSA